MIRIIFKLPDKKIYFSDILSGLRGILSDIITHIGCIISDILPPPIRIFNQIFLYLLQIKYTMIRRKLFEDLQAHLLKKEYTIITGARQTGKSTLLKQLEVYCKEMEIPVVFLNLENKTILAELKENPLNLLRIKLV